MKKFIPLFLLLFSCVTIPIKPQIPVETPPVSIPLVDTLPIIATKISFAPSLGATSYNLYTAIYPNLVDNTCPSIPLGKVTSIEVSKILAPGVYNLGISALDKQGNESAIRLSERAIIVIAPIL